MAAMGDAIDGLVQMIKVAGLVVLLLIAYIVYSWVVSEDYSGLLEDCEAQLSREQSCKMIAIPQGGAEGEG